MFNWKAVIALITIGALVVLGYTLWGNPYVRAGLSLSLLLLVPFTPLFVIWLVYRLKPEHFSKTITYGKNQNLPVTGLFVSPLLAVFLRVTISTTIAGVGTVLVVSLTTLLGVSTFQDVWWLWIPLLVGIFLLAYRPNTDNMVFTNAKGESKTMRRFRVPTNHCAYLTWLGRRYEIFLTEGNFPWLPTYLGFGIDNTPITNAVNQEGYVFGEEQGFVYIGERVLDIWNSIAKDARSVRISNETRLGSRVSVSLQITVVTSLISRYVNNSDPILQIANKARDSLRAAVAVFTDRDITRIADKLEQITTGHRVFCAHTKHKTPEYAAGTLVKDDAGQPIMSVLPPPRELPHKTSGMMWEQSTDAEKQAMEAENAEVQEKIDRENAQADAELLQKICDQIHPDFLDGFKKHQNDTSDNKATSDEEAYEAIRVTIHYLESNISNTVRDSGCILTLAVVSDVQLSDEVSFAGREAVAAQQKRVTDLVQAGTVLEIQDQYVKAAQNADELSRILAFGDVQEGSVQIMHVTGDGAHNPIVKAAGVLGSSDGKTNVTPSGSTNKDTGGTDK